MKKCDGNLRSRKRGNLKLSSYVIATFPATFKMQGKTAGKLKYNDSPFKKSLTEKWKLKVKLPSLG